MQARNLGMLRSIPRVWLLFSAAIDSVLRGRFAKFLTPCLTRGGGTRNSYCLGASDELSRLAQEEKAAEEVEARRAEMDLTATKLMQKEAERQAQLNRLTSLPRSLQSPEPAVKADTSTVSNGSTPQETGRGRSVRGAYWEPACCHSGTLVSIHQHR